MKKHPNSLIQRHKWLICMKNHTKGANRAPNAPLCMKMHPKSLIQRHNWLICMKNHLKIVDHAA